MHRPAVLALSASVLFAACEQDGTARYAGTTTWTDDAGVARVRYESPPWNARGGDAESIELEVDTLTGPDSGVPPKFVVHAAVEPGSAMTALSADLAAAARRHETVVPEADGGGTFSTVTTDSGHAGMRWSGIIVAFDSRAYEHVAFDVPGGRVLHIQIEANSDPHTPEMEAMVRSVDVQPFSPP